MLTMPVSERDHMEGPASAPVTLVEYGDYQCPHCGRAYPVVEELRRIFGDAKSRDAHIYCEVVGYSLNNNAFHMTTPLPAVRTD